MPKNFVVPLQQKSGREGYPPWSPWPGLVVIDMLNSTGGNLVKRNELEKAMCGDVTFFFVKRY